MDVNASYYEPVKAKLENITMFWEKFQLGLNVGLAIQYINLYFYPR
jgi:hypothetical protein